ncbi:hypothetical protein INR49_027549 [Caranx melampygus]|nr:hypothetical protein INR49_027549 [Caranx melampygus]
MLFYRLLLCFSVTGFVSAQPDSSGLFYALRSELSEDAILVANNGIRVPFGRSVFIDPINDLVIQTQPGDRCSITVLDNDPLSQRPGHLSPKKFPCDFGPNDVTYSHYGSRSPAKDRVRLQLRYDAQTETVIIPFMMEVEVVFTQLELLTKNMPLTVDSLKGLSNPIDKKILEFTYDRDSHKCEVASLSSGSPLPRYGRLVDGGKLSQMMDCDEFTQADIRYEHTFDHKSPNRDYVPMVVELHDKEGNLVKQEYFHLMIRIKEGEENTRPKPSFVSMMMVEVSQFVMTALTSDMLAAEDAESDPDELIFNITSPLSYEEGYIVSTDDRNLPITSFYQRDLRDLKIAYKPPSLDSDTERIFQLEFEVVDTDGAVSDPFAFMIVVKPMNSLAPVVTRNTGQLLYEGQSRPLFTTHNLEISDEDNLDMVTISVVDGLRHGDLMVLGSQRKFFTPADLTTGVVVYQHDGSDTYSDNIVFKMTDGKNEVEFLFPITIVPTDDEPPIINANTGLVLFKNQMMPISPLMLSAADIDSEDSTIKFTIVPPLSTIGTVLLRQSDAPEDPSSWKFNAEDEVYEKEVTEWLQKDITDGKLFYKHTGPHNTDTVVDQFMFTVQDDNDPPNESGENAFIIRVLPIDDVPPELFPGTTLQMTVQEYKLTQFNKEVLRYTDLDSEDRDLKYTIIQPPTDTDENNPALFGSLVLTDSPDTEVTEFTQAQINHHKISYGPPDVELGITAHVVQFRYTVEDTAGNSVEGAFTIYLQPVNNKPPQITNTGFTVLERGMHIITIAELDATDLDTESKQITFTLSQLPKHGQIQVAFTDLEKKGVFRLEDISEGKISYTHNGEETVSDEFQLDVSDGIHVVTVTVKVNVKPIDDETPTVSLPEGTIGSHMDVLENGATEITTNVIQGHDDDTDDLQLTFIVEDPPVMGEILVKGVPATRFTQADIINGVVVYAHTGGEIGLSSQQDGFNLTLTDMSDEWTVGGNKVNGVQVRVTILPVDSQAPEVGVENHFFPIVIIPANDEKPEIYLREIVVMEGMNIIIDTPILNAADADIPPEELTFIISKPPKYGLVVYTHNGQEGIRDLVKFDVTDGMNPLIDRYFYITVGSIDMVFPDVVSKGVSLREGGRVTLTTDLLSTTDLNSPDENLAFTITRAPVRGHLECTDTPGMPIVSFTQLQLAGSKVYYIHTSDDEVKMDSFEFEVTDGYNPIFRTFRISIVDVDNKKPVVTVNSLLVTEGQTKLITPFELTAEDQDTAEKLLKFTITQLPVHGKLLYNHSTPVTSFTKQDLNENLISYKHDGTESSEDSFSFTVTDGTHTDFFVFPDTVFETRHPQTMKITIVAIDNGVPQILVNKGAPTLKILPTGHLGFPITPNVLKAKDRDSSPASLVFHITTQPKHGYIINLGHGNNSIDTFSQADIEDLNVCYVLRNEENATSDLFHFSVEDNGGNKLKGQQFRLDWAWISLEREYYVVDEEDKFLEVTLKRRGYLGETSFIEAQTQGTVAPRSSTIEIRGAWEGVFPPAEKEPRCNPSCGVSLPSRESSTTGTMVLLPFKINTSSLLWACERIGTQDGSAKKEEDFKGKSQKQIQFNPGQTRATWRVRILTDGKYEQAETFQILLSEPVMGVMEFPATATVEILDPNDATRLHTTLS